MQNPVITAFDKSAKETLEASAFSPTHSPTDMYQNICDAINKVAETTLPKRAKSSKPRRKVSAATKKLYEQRVKMKDMSKAERKDLPAATYQRSRASRLQAVGGGMC